MNNFIQLINVKGDFFNSFVFQVRAHITFFYYYKILILFYRFSCKRGSRRRRLSAIVFASLHPFNITLIDLWRLFVGSRKLFQTFFFTLVACAAF